MVSKRVRRLSLNFAPRLHRQCPQSFSVTAWLELLLGDVVSLGRPVSLPLSLSGTLNTGDGESPSPTVDIPGDFV